MPIIVGIDEAGYGPKLGPLVITATAFEVDIALLPVERIGRADRLDLWNVLKEAVSGCQETRAQDDGRIRVGDSKKLYSTKKGLGQLEEGVLAFHMCLGEEVSELKDLLNSLLCYDEQLFRAYPWYHKKKLHLPIESDAENIINKHLRLKDTLLLSGVRYLAARGAVVPTHEFNLEVATTGNKSLLLFKKYVKLIFDISEEYAVTEVFCGKHGGRNRYGPMLSAAFGGSRVKTLLEDGNSFSCYEISYAPVQRRLKVSFLKSAEDVHLPVALASMYSKYVRELFLRLFNTFWQERIPGLRPTAGYPSDAERFLRDIKGLKTGLGISDEILVRNR